METTIISVKTGTFLTFRLGEETYAVHVSKVLNILEMSKITKIPKSPSYMIGVINLRGTVLPLIDLRIKFSMPEQEKTTNTCILVLDIRLGNEPVRIGAMVDSVQEVLEITDKQVQPPPRIGTRYKSEFVEGMAKIGDNFILMLNVENILSTEEIITIKDTKEKGKKLKEETV